MVKYKSNHTAECKCFSSPLPEQVLVHLSSTSPSPDHGCAELQSRCNYSSFSLLLFLHSSVVHVLLQAKYQLVHVRACSLIWDRYVLAVFFEPSIAGPLSVGVAHVLEGDLVLKATLR